MIFRVFCTAFAGLAFRAALGLAAGVLVALLPAETQNAVANGDTRTIQLYHAHTHEAISATFLVDGSYDQAVLDKLNWFLRDWRRDEPTKMDPRLFDVIWEVYREAGSHQPIEVMSAYRSPETNAMLRRRSRGVAEHSQHILGKAMDQHYMDVPMSRIREIAMRLQRGGVGFYPTAGTPFVHMDVGGVRHWPRMSYDQLAQLFPDGKTVHIPSNGQPLPGYELARAELEGRGGSLYPTASQIKSKGFFAWLFGGSDEAEDEASESGGRGHGPSRGAAVAVAERGSGAPLYNMSDKDGGARAFSASQQARLAPTEPLARVAVEPTPVPAADTVTPPQASMALAVAMSPEKAESQAGAASSVPARAVPDLAVPTQTLTTNGLVVPMPPRRPTELATVDSLPLPPVRPAELRSHEPPAPTPPIRTARADGLSQSQNGRGTLPAGMTQGGPAAPAQILAFAGGDRASLWRSATTAVPLPIPRPPELVGARLDRSNFRSLTAQTKTDHDANTSPLGAVLGLRAASRAGRAAYAPPPATAANFGSKVSDLTPDRFSGQALKPNETLVTARRAEPIRSSPD